MIHRVLVAISAMTVSACCGQSSPELVAKVASGELKEAKASWWGFDPTDSTDALQAAIRSGVPTLVIDQPGKPWIVRPILLESNQTIVFDKGVVIQAKRGEFKGKGDCLFTISQQSNVVLRGPGATLRMHRADYDNPELYEKAEWRHALSIRSSKNVEVHGLTLALSGGDGIYLGVSKRGVSNENVVIRDVVCDRNYRQGISVISARNLLIENTVMKDTGGTPPQAGIDFEPNHPTEELVNCVMRNCVSEGNMGVGYTFYLPNLRADSAPISVRLEDCVCRGNRSDFGFTTGNAPADTVSGSIDVVRCRFERARDTAIRIRQKPVEGAAVRFSECVIDSPAVDSESAIPVVIASRTGCSRSVGGIDFGELIVVDPVDRPFLDYEDWIGGSGVESVQGTFRVVRDNAETVQPLTPEWLRNAFPPRVLRHIDPMPLDGVNFVPANVAAGGVAGPASPCFLRKKATLAVFAQRDETVSLSLLYEQVGKYGGKPMKVVAIGPSGQKIPAGEIAYMSTGEARFRAPESGVYRLPLDANPNKFAVHESTRPVAVSGEDGPIHFVGAAGDLRFLVPAGTKEFGLLIYGEGKQEAIGATVFGPDGQQVWEQDRITLPEMFAPDILPTDHDQVWRLRLSKPTGIVCEDNYVDLRGIPPFLARDPRALLTASPVTSGKE